MNIGDYIFSQLEIVLANPASNECKIIFKNINRTGVNSGSTSVMLGQHSTSIDTTLLGSVGLAPVAATGFSHRLTAYKIMGHFFGLSYRKISGIIRSKIVFLESVTFQFHARMLSSEVAQSLKCYGHFLDLGVEIALSHRHVGFFG